MKRTVSFTLALLLVLFSFGKAEAATSPQCETVLALDAVSPYTKAVLKRATDGIEYAKTANVDLLYYLFPWTQHVGSVISSLVDSEQRLTTRTDDLIHNTACLRFDLLSIQCKMEEAQNELNAQLERGSPFAIVQLESLLQFLNDRYAQINLGAFDAQYRDPKWGEIQIFDPPSTTTPASFEAPMCPYTSDYAPPFVNGFGCDETILKPRTSFKPLAAEEESLKLITSQLETYRLAAEQFVKVQNSIRGSSTTPSGSTPPVPRRAHLTAEGCQWTGGLCDNDPRVHCQKDADCSDNGQCKTPPKICKANRAVSCFDDAECQLITGDVGPCIAQDGKVPGTMELRGPFSLGENYLGILERFLKLRLRQGTSREYPENLKTADDVPDTGSGISTDDLNNDPFMSLEVSSLRQLFRSWSALQGRDEAASFPYITDAQLQVADALGSLRSAVSGLSKLVTKKDEGLRVFITRYASFLHRSCIYRPCTASLEEILKIALTDECFPYTNGDYLKDTKDDPRWKKCAEGAKIDVK